jgi:hypothetical protein
MNDPFVVNQADRMAGRVMEHGSMDESARIDLAYQIAYGRPATSTEKERASIYLASYVGSSKSPALVSAGWTSLCQALIASAEFRYVN